MTRVSNCTSLKEEVKKEKKRLVSEWKVAMENTERRKEGKERKKALIV